MYKNYTTDLAVTHYPVITVFTIFKQYYIPQNVYLAINHSTFSTFVIS